MLGLSLKLRYLTKYLDMNIVTIFVLPQNISTMTFSDPQSHVYKTCLQNSGQMSIWFISALYRGWLKMPQYTHEPHLQLQWKRSQSGGWIKAFALFGSSIVAKCITDVVWSANKLIQTAECLLVFLSRSHSKSLCSGTGCFYCPFFAFIFDIFFIKETDVHLFYWPIFHISCFSFIHIYCLLYKAVGEYSKTLYSVIIHWIIINIITIIVDYLTSWPA